MSTNAETADAPAIDPPAVTPDGPAGAPAPKVHLGYLDSLRALAAVDVVIYHAMYQIDPHHPVMTGVAGALRSLFDGHYAVDLFIVLSGFCLMLPIVRGDGRLCGGAWSFFQRRAWRILPPYFLSIVYSLLVIWLFIGRPVNSPHYDFVPVTAQGIWTHLLLVQDAYHNSQINPPLWSVAVEWRIYFAFPLLVLLWRKIGPLPTTVLSVVAGYVLLALLRPTWVETHPSGVSPEYLGLFAMGMLGAGIAFSKEPRLVGLRTLPWAAVLVLMAALVLILKRPIIHGHPLQVSVINSLVGLLAMSLLIVSGPGGIPWLHRALSWRPLAFVGTFAYSIYLFHAPLLPLLWQHCVYPLHLGTLGGLLVEAFVITPIVVAITYVLYLCFERPFVKRPIVLNTK